MGDREFMELAISEAAKSSHEDSRIHPRVGVVVVRGDSVLATAYRGQTGTGDHAEFGVLEKKLGSETLAGATVYTTLEPCTTRNHPKVPCAIRLKERKVARVSIGMLDPNPNIGSRGVRVLRDANIAVDLFPVDLAAKVEELNREFIRAQARIPRMTVGDPDFVALNKSRSLDQWYRSINGIYWSRNSDRAREAVFAHLVEVVGGLSLLASAKKKPEITPEAFMPKAVAWWLTLCGRLRVKSVEELLWTKFPAVCAYCAMPVHDPAICLEIKRASPGPNWSRLAELGLDRRNLRPGTIGGWQRMFQKIYPVQQTELYGPTFARLSEELGELAEAVRTFEEAPGYFVSEAADVFAWLMHIQNIYEQEREVLVSDRGLALDERFCQSYPDLCPDCGSPQCTCPRILPETMGRIAHEVPTSAGLFLPSDRAAALFRTSGRALVETDGPLNT